jgi:hypothetical protein
MNADRNLDPRTTPARPDLAAAYLKGQIQAERFVEGIRRRVIEAAAPLRRHPSPDAPLDTEILYGERVVVYETTEEGWAWVQAEHDSYVGWLPAGALADTGAAPTDRVSVLRTLVFPGPNIKLPPLEFLSFGSRITVVRRDGDFAVSDRGGFIPARHLAPLQSLETDYVSVAQRFVGTPYLWGGRSSLGIDCSGLVQIALQSAGHACPRDSDMQAAFGTPVSFDGDFSMLRRGDLLCWKGHIGIVSAPDRLLHANAFHMAVAEEPLSAAIARIGASGAHVQSVRRPELRT